MKKKKEVSFYDTHDKFRSLFKLWFLFFIAHWLPYLSGFSHLPIFLQATFYQKNETLGLG